MRIEADTKEGTVRVDADAVTPRELHSHLGSVYRRIDDVGDALSDVRVDFEKRFGRIERLVLALAIAVASPKLGGPDVPKLVSGTVLSLFT